MSDRRLALWMAWLIPLIFAVIGPYSVNDLAGWIAHGQYFLDHREILRHDIFSVLPTSPLIYPAWGLSVVYALIYRVSNLMTVCLFHYALLCVLLWIVYRASILKLADPANKVARFATYVFWLGAAAALGERPSMVALIPLVLAFLLIADISRLSDLGVKRITKLCLLNVLWVNIHGSFILLWLMLLWKTAWLGLDERRKIRPRDLGRLFFAHAAIGLSALVNPFGWRIFPYVLETVARSKGRWISEWAPTTPFAYFPTGLLYFLLLGTTLFLLFRASRKPGKPGFLRTLSNPFFLLLLNGATAIRNAAIPFVVLLPTLKQMGYLDRGDDRLDARDKDRCDSPARALSRPRRSNYAKIALFVVILILVFPTVKPRIASFLPPGRREVFDNTAVFKIAEAIRHTGRTCPIYNGWEVGSFLLLNLPNKIFIDGRNIIYSDEQFRDYLRVSLAQPGWQTYLDRYGACFAVLDRKLDSPLILALRARNDWKFVMEEKGNLLFERATSL